MSKTMNLDEFKDSLKSKSVDELKKIEEKIVAECETIDKEVSEKEFDMPTENYSEVAKAIKFFLNKQTVQWQYTLGMVAMYDFWTEDCPKTIPLLYSSRDQPIAGLSCYCQMKCTGAAFQK